MRNVVLLPKVNYEKPDKTNQKKEHDYLKEGFGRFAVKCSNKI
jgi:hypothetical protein